MFVDMKIMTKRQRIFVSRYWEISGRILQTVKIAFRNEFSDDKISTPQTIDNQGNGLTNTIRKTKKYEYSSMYYVPELTRIHHTFFSLIRSLLVFNIGSI